MDTFDLQCQFVIHITRVTNMIIKSRSCQLTHWIIAKAFRAEKHRKQRRWQDAFALMHFAVTSSCIDELRTPVMPKNEWFYRCRIKLKTDCEKGLRGGQARDDQSRVWNCWSHTTGRKLNQRECIASHSSSCVSDF